jgi:hypothetical protein
MMTWIKFGHFSGGGSASCFALIIGNAIFGNLITEGGFMTCAITGIFMFAVFMACLEEEPQPPAPMPQYERD